MPRPSKSEQTRTESLDPERAESILAYLNKYEYGSFRHVLFPLIWQLGTRLSGVQALDLDDFHPASEHGPYLEFVDRPEQGTSLKNDWKSERLVPLRDGTKDILVDYIDAQRHDAVDEHGREPLLTTVKSRPGKTTIRTHIYAATRPCWRGEDCPVGRDPVSCDATGSTIDVSKCPESKSRHSLRRGGATANLYDGIDPETVSNMLDMSPDTLRKQYNVQTKEDEMQLMREYMEQ